MENKGSLGTRCRGEGKYVQSFDQFLQATALVLGLKISISNNCMGLCYFMLLTKLIHYDAQEYVHIYEYNVCHVNSLGLSMPTLLN